MCACDATFTCSRCAGSRFGPNYLLEDPEPNDPYYELPAETDVSGFEVAE